MTRKLIYILGAVIVLGLFGMGFYTLWKDETVKATGMTAVAAETPRHGPQEVLKYDMGVFPNKEKANIVNFFCWKAKGRVVKIENGCTDSYVLAPGASLSIDSKFGPFNAEQGMKEYENVIGFGVSQAASMLGCAAQQAGLTVTGTKEKDLGLHLPTGCRQYSIWVTDKNEPYLDIVLTNKTSGTITLGIVVDAKKLVINEVLP